MNTDEWKRLSVPSKSGRDDFVFQRDDGIFILGRNLDKIGRFDLDQNEWHYHTISTSREMLPSDRYFAFDADENTIWMHSFEDSYCTLFKVRLSVNSCDVKSIEESEPPYHYCIDHLFEFQILIVGDLLCIVGYGPCIGDGTHITVNKHTLDFQERHLDSFVNGDALICIKNILYLFGCVSRDVQDPDGENVLFSYSLETEEWTQHQAANRESRTLGMRFDETCAVALNVSPLQQYIVLFRGLDPSDYTIATDLIVVYDVQQNAFRKCSLKLPPAAEDVCYDACVLRHRSKERLSVMGFVRECYKSAEFEEVSMIPDVIQELLCKSMCIEYVHLIGRGGDLIGCSGDAWNSHFCIAVDDILSAFLPE